MILYQQKYQHPPIGVEEREDIILILILILNIGCGEIGHILLAITLCGRQENLTIMVARKIV